jgi:uncharacterized membrane protein (Fun14 family)
MDQFSEVVKMMGVTGAYGFGVGFVAGFLLKKVAKVVLFLGLVALVGVYYLVTNGTIDLGWFKMDMVMNALPQIQGAVGSAVRWIMASLPFGVLGATGFILGLKVG